MRKLTLILLIHFCLFSSTLVTANNNTFRSQCKDNCGFARWNQDNIPAEITVFVRLQLESTYPNGSSIENSTYVSQFQVGISNYSALVIPKLNKHRVFVGVFYNGNIIWSSESRSWLAENVRDNVGVQNRTFVFQINNGRLGSGSNWENAIGANCGQLFRQSCQCLDGDCAYPCLDVGSSNIRGWGNRENTCDLAIYIGFKGSDKDGRPLTSADFFIEALGNRSIQSNLDCVKFVQDEEKIFLNPSISLPEAERVTLELGGPREKLYFEGKKVTAGIVTCGGLCPGLNNVIQAIVYTLYFRYGVDKCLGFKFGYEGMNPEKGVPPVWLTVKSNQKTTNMEFEQFPVKDIHHFGGTILGSSRGPQPVDKMVNFLKALDVQMLFTIGGDGTLKGASAIYQACKDVGYDLAVIGVPKTIDNDIDYVEKTFGFETAVSLAQIPISGVHEEARSARNGIGIVKLMGRDSGFIALNASLASSDVNLVLLPEVTFDLETIFSVVESRLASPSGHCVIVVSEGAGQNLIKGMKEGTPSESKKDASGNVVYDDIGVFLKTVIGNHLNGKGITHSIKYIDPSYSIRSARANPMDAVFSVLLSQMAVHAAMAGKTNLVVGRVNNRFVHIPISKAIEKRKKVDIQGPTYQGLLDNTGMPHKMTIQ